MLSLSQTHNDRRLIRVLVAPIGNNSLFADQFQIVSSLKAIPFYELNRPPTSKASPFKFLNWKDGELLFEYLRYDRSSAGPGDLDDFQSSKKIWMVMGLINFPELIMNTKVVSEEIEHFIRRYGHIGLKRIFVFNYNFDVQPSLQLKPLKNDPDSLIIFPPEGACEGGSMIVVHFKEVMCHATVKLINVFERLMEVCEDARLRNIFPNELPLHTVYDDREDIVLKDTPPPTALISTSASVRGSSKARLFKRKPSGRLQKYMADLSMQVCSPLDAIDHYIAAIVELRSTGDALWLAGALDGYASVVLMLKERQFNLDEIIGKDLKSVSLPTLPETDDPLPEIDRVYALAEERMCEAISVYSSSVVLRILEVEATLRLARIFEKADFFYEKEQKIVDYVMKAASIPGLNSQQQIEVTLEGALICHRLGLKRKYSLFLYIAALMTAESGNYEMADALLMETFLRLEESSEDRPGASVELCSAWSAVKSAVFTNGVILAQETNNLPSSATFLSALLQLVCRAELRQCIQNARLSKYTNRLLGLEIFAKRNKISSSNTSSAPPVSGLTEESLKRLQAKESLHQAATTEHLSRRNSSSFRDFPVIPTVGIGYGGPSGKARSVNSDLTSLAGALKGSIRPGFGENNGSGNNSQSGSVKLSNPMSSPKPAVATNFAAEKPPNPPGTPVMSQHRTASDKLTPTNHVPGPTLRRNSQQSLTELMSSQPAVSDNSDFLANQFTELTSAAEHALKQGLRSISVPSLPHKLSTLLTKENSESKEAAATAQYPVTGSARKRPSSLRRHPSSNSHASTSSYSTPSKSHKIFNDKFLKTLLESNIFDGNVANGIGVGDDEGMATVGSSGTGAVGGGMPANNLADPRVMHHLIDLEQAKDIFQSLSQALSTSSLLPIDQQEIALNLFYQIADRVEKVEQISLPVSLLRVFPLILPHPMQPVPLRPDEYPLFKAFASFVEKQIDLRKKQLQPVSPSANESSSGAAPSTFRFIVDPFSKRKEKKVSRMEEVYWSEGMMCHLRFHFKNPLAIPIQLTTITPILSGCKHVVYPVAVEIPPESDLFEVFLPIRCLEQGIITVHSVQLKIGNFKQEIAIDKGGFPVTRSVGLDGSVDIKPSNSSTSPSSSSMDVSPAIDTNKVSIVDKHSTMQCFSSWELPPLIAVQGPTPNHVHTQSTRLSIYAGEVRHEKIWLKIHPQQEIQRNGVRVFQVVVHEFEKQTMTKRSYLLQDFLPMSSKSHSTAGSSSQSSSTYSPANNCLLQHLQHTSIACKGEEYKRQEGTMEADESWEEFSFDVFAKAGVSSFDFEVNTITLPSDVHDSLRRFVELDATAHSEIVDWLEDYHQERRKVTDLQSVFGRKLVLHVSLQCLSGLSCTAMNLIQLPTSSSSDDDMLLRRLLLQQWQCSQLNRQQLLSVSSISVGVPLLSPPGKKSLFDQENSAKDPPALTFPTTMIFCQRIRLQFLIKNQSNAEQLIGTSLETLKTQCGARAKSEQRSSRSKSTSLIFKLEEIIQSDFTLVVPAKTVYQFVVEYPQSLFRDFLQRESPGFDMQGGLLSQIPLYWMYYDEEKVARSIKVTDKEAQIHWEIASASSSTEGCLRFGRLSSSHTSISDVEAIEKDSNRFVNLGFQSEKPVKDPSLSSASSSGAGRSMRRSSAVDSSAVIYPLSEVGQLLQRFPLLDVTANIRIVPSAPHRLPLQQSTSSPSSSFTVNILQKIDLDLLFDYSAAVSLLRTKSICAPKQLEVLLILTDLLDDLHFQQLKETLDKHITQDGGHGDDEESDEEERGGARGMEGEDEEEDGGYRQSQRATATEEEDGGASPSSAVSYLINGKMHCKYNLAARSTPHQLSHRVNLSFLNSSRYALYVFFRLQSDSGGGGEEEEAALWWSCETPINFIVVTPS